MSRTNFQELLDAGVHFGHLARKWNPKMAPYIFDQKNGIHIIDLHKTIGKIDEAAEEMKQLAKSGRKILFVATGQGSRQGEGHRGQHALRHGALGRRHADQLPDDPQGRQENVHHR